MCVLTPNTGRWGTHIVKANPHLAEDIVAAVAQLGPSTAGHIKAHLAAEPRRKKGTWWTRSDTKRVAEALFASGVLTTATRVGFARITTWWSGCCGRACWPVRSTTTRPSGN